MKILITCFCLLTTFVIIILSPATGGMSVLQTDFSSPWRLAEHSGTSASGFPVSPDGILIEAIGYAVASTFLILFFAFLHSKLKGRAIF